MSKKVTIMGKWISLDEKTISFNGRRVDKFRINYKSKVMDSNATQYVLMDTRLVLTFEMLHHHNKFLINVYVHYMPG